MRELLQVTLINISKQKGYFVSFLRAVGKQSANRIF